MSAATTALANEALTMIRAKNKLNDIDTDTDPNALVARTFLTEHTSEILEELDLRAFSVTEALNDITDSEPPPTGWSYRYTWPSTCMVPREIIIGGFVPNQTPIEFDVELIPNKSKMSILCQEESASLRYTTNEFVEDVSKWPHNFRRAVVYRLAASLATGIKDDPRMAGQMMGFFIDAARMAAHVNESGRRRITSQAPGSLRARKGARLV